MTHDLFVRMCKRGIGSCVSFNLVARETQGTCQFIVPKHEQHTSMVKTHLHQHFD